MSRESRRLLVIAAHPDDETLGCGGTMALAASRGWPVRVLIMGEGITARHDPERFSDPDVLAEIARRNDCARKALDILGLDPAEVFIGQRTCCRMDREPLIELTKEMERHIRDFAPTHLLTHSPHDVNVDHGVVARAAMAAVRPTGNGGPRTVMSFEILSSTEWNTTSPFAPTVFQDITGHLARKLEALAAFDGEMFAPPHARSLDCVEALARFRGGQAGVLHAEAFALVRQVLD